MSTLNAPSPHIHHTAARAIPPAAALAHLQSYLDATQDATQAHLHPDCRFDEHGPTLEGRAPGSGLTLHHMARLAAGLRGERLMPEVVEVVGDEDVNGELTEEESGRGDDAGLGVQTDASYNEQMRAQGEEGIVEGELGERETGVDGDGEIPEIEETGKRKRERGGEEVDKEARRLAKREKKERARAEREGREDMVSGEVQIVNGDSVEASRKERSKKEKRKIKGSEHAVADGDREEVEGKSEKRKDKKKRKKDTGAHAG